MLIRREEELDLPALLHHLPARGEQAGNGILGKGVEEEHTVSTEREPITPREEHEAHLHAKALAQVGLPAEALAQAGDRIARHMDPHGRDSKANREKIIKTIMSP